MSTSIIGAPITRIDGSLKVTGAARYAVDHSFDNIAFGVPVASTVGNARIASIDTSIAQRMPGVLTIIHHGNTDQLFRPAGQLEQSSRAGEVRPPFEDDKVYYYGQYVAVVVANTFEQAQDAASKLKIDYEQHPNIVSIGAAPPPAGPSPHPLHPRQRRSGLRKRARQNRRDLHPPRRNPQPHGDARHHRQMGRRQSHPLRILAGRRQPSARAL